MFNNVLDAKDPKYSPIAPLEKLKALEILQGIFLMHPPSKDLVVDNEGIKVNSYRCQSHEGVNV